MLVVGLFISQYEYIFWLNKNVLRKSNATTTSVWHRYLHIGVAWNSHIWYDSKIVPWKCDFIFIRFDFTFHYYYDFIAISFSFVDSISSLSGFFFDARVCTTNSKCEHTHKHTHIRHSIVGNSMWINVAMCRFHTFSLSTSLSRSLCMYRC